MDAKQIKNKVYQAGVVGAGGAGFPTHVKLNINADIYLVNGAECEPLLKVDQQLAAKYAQLLIRGLSLGMKANNSKEGIIALKEKYTDAIPALKPLLHDNMRIHILKDVYPAGDEVITIWMATGRRVPPAALPIDVGVVVSNVQTLINVAKAVDNDLPVTQRTLTITGAVHKPITVTVPLGISFKELIEFAGGETIPNPAYINGGPMMGRLINDLSEVVTKTTGGIIVLPSDHIIVQRHKEPMQKSISIARSVCEQCCLCTELCPRHIIGHELPPHLIVRSVNYNNIGNPSILLSALTCSECAICEAWACPVDISPMKLNKALKAEFRKSGTRYVGTLRALDPMAEDRMVPVSRLVRRLDILKYNVKAPLDESTNSTNSIYSPKSVKIKLQQHIGAPAQPIVNIGDSVVIGQLIAQMPEGSLGAFIHASITGIVEKVDDKEIIIRNQN